MMQDKLTPKQILLRILSIIIGAIGASTCVQSLMLQVTDTGSITATITWFSGLLSIVAACGGYACTTDRASKKNFVWPSVIIGAVLAGCLLYYETKHVYASEIITYTIIALLVQIVALVIYHFVLRAQDPNAAYKAVKKDTE